MKVFFAFFVALGGDYFWHQMLPSWKWKKKILLDGAKSDRDDEVGDCSNGATIIDRFIDLVAV